MPLRDPTDIPFSELKNNFEPKQAWIMVSGNRKSVLMTCYGYLPDGRSYGIVEIGVWFKPGYYENYATLVTPDGECKYLILMKDHYDLRLPDAMAAVPSGHHIVWKVGKDLYCWEPNDYLDYMGVVHLNDRLPDITDAALHQNGILEIYLDGGKKWLYDCKSDALLEPAGNGWIVQCSSIRCNGYNDSLRNLMDDDSGINSLILENNVESVGAFVFSGYGIRDLELSQKLTVIGWEAFAENPMLEKITIPAVVMDVESGAFRECTGLRELVIEGDLSRIANWAEDAFTGCPCENFYLNLRGCL